MKSKNIFKGILPKLLVIAAVVLQASLVNAQHLDLSEAKVYFPLHSSGVFAKPVQVLREEIQKRTQILLRITRKVQKRSDDQHIVLVLEKDVHRLGAELQSAIKEMTPIGPEGFLLRHVKNQKVLLIMGEGQRGLLYGVGHLLRKLELRPGEILAPSNLNLSTSPKYLIRGHQLGYRPKTNAYDAWTVAQFDQYIRELALFGANSIEIMPPRTDDDSTSRHMILPAIKMIEEQARICDEYDMDVWMWYPNMGTNYEHPDSIEKELMERHEVFKSVKRLDALFVPGGDPGDLAPKILFNWLGEVAGVLHQYHPNAKIWVSPQVFRPNREWFDAFYALVNNRYSWFGGVVFGPWVKTTLQENRNLVHQDIPIRRYPDITHSLSSQYPIPDWDLAYAISLGRECINPRPTDQKKIHNAMDELAQGSLSYSEGTNDDLNKFIWSDQDWDPETPVIETLRDYARLFIGPDFTEVVAQGFLALEKNIQGPLLGNENIGIALQQWQSIENEAKTLVKNNFRLQQGLIRAYFDAYIQRRLVYETELEAKARETLLNAETEGSRNATKRAREILTEAWNKPVAIKYKEKCMELADLHFNSIGAQLTIEKHGAMGGRGNFIDFIDIPLNDVAWIFSNLNEIEVLDKEEERLIAIHDMLHRSNPGPGGFYDNFGNPESWRRIVLTRKYTEDPGHLQSPRISFGVGLRGKEWVHEITAKGFEGQAVPLAWMNQVTTLYDLPLEMIYENLNPKDQYKIKVSYTGRFRSNMKLESDGILVHDFIRTGTQPTYEFDIPIEATQDGQVKFSWTCGEGERGSQVSEIWLIRK